MFEEAEGHPAKPRTLICLEMVLQDIGKFSWGYVLGCLIG
jgi:hypothetical protein